MALQRSIKATEHIITKQERGDKQKDEQQCLTTAAMTGLGFHILELPINIIYEILSRLPLKAIFCCKCVCKAFLKLIGDPFFAQTHLMVPTTTPIIVLQEHFSPSGFAYMFVLDLDETSTSSSSSDHHPCDRHPPHHALTKKKFCFPKGKMTLVGSCNGLLCLYHVSSQKSMYYICNPILGEYTVLPCLIPSKPASTYLNRSGFGFCPKTKQYKVIHFTCLTSFDPSTALTLRKTVAEVHTLGTDSWRSIGDAPCLRLQGSFDPFLNGALHWITERFRTCDLICSFDLETEQFRPVPPPSHFDPDYVNKISWINIGVLGGCLCVCYAFCDALFEVWVMKEYGVKRSWAREFAIDIKFYCGLRVEHMHQPIKFLNNGDLWLICNSNSLVSYSPQKRTFRDFKTLGPYRAEVIAHVPSFISLKDTVVGQNLKVNNVKWVSNLLYEVEQILI